MHQHQKLAWQALFGRLSSEKPLQLGPTYTETVLWYISHMTRAVVSATAEQSARSRTCAGRATMIAHLLCNVGLYPVMFAVSMRAASQGHSKCDVTTQLENAPAPAPACWPWHTSWLCGQRWAPQTGTATLGKLSKMTNFGKTGTSSGSHASELCMKTEKQNPLGKIPKVSCLTTLRL